MSLVKAALKQIRKYGFKGAAELVPILSTSNNDTLEVTQGKSLPIPLNSYAGSYPSSKIDGTTIFVNDRRVLATPDDDWDGSISRDDGVTIEGDTYEVISFSTKRVKNVIAYVEIQCRG